MVTSIVRSPHHYGHVCSVPNCIVAFQRFGSIGRRYDNSGSGGSVALNHDRTYRRGWFIRVNSRVGDSAFAIVFGCFSRIKKFYPELRRELVRGSAFNRYEQFETSLETIEQELRPAV